MTTIDNLIQADEEEVAGSREVGGAPMRYLDIPMHIKLSLRLTLNIFTFKGYCQAWETSQTK